MPRPYVPLHVYTSYSLLDSATRIPSLVQLAKEKDMPAVAITDSGVMYGAIELYQKAKSAGIKPIIGCKMFVIDGDPTDRVSRRHLNHVVLLAKDRVGYQNLVKLVSKAQLEGFYYKPRINWEQLADHSEGLISLTGGLSGPIANPILRNNPEEARERLGWLKNVFSEDLYLEIQDHGMEGERRVNAELVKFSREYGVDLVATNGSHYNRPEDAQVHDILMCLQNGKLVSDPSRFQLPNNAYYVKDGDELLASFDLDTDIVEKAIETTLGIADKCNLELDLDATLLPDYPVPAGETSESYLEKLVQQTAHERYGTMTSEIEHRIRYELDVINQMGFPAYFLIVWDFIKAARTMDIPVGPGRGSAAGSIVAYSLGITSIDPIEHNLLFERFLNPERISMPDIDIDFCIDRREDIIRYVSERYGQERVAQIITFGSFAARAALKAVARVKDIPFAESDRLAKMIPTTVGTKLQDALQPDMELGKLYATDAQVKELVDLALQIEGISANTGIHAAGVVISKDPLRQVVPLQLSKEGQVVTQYAMDDIAKLGLLKMDFLGLRNLTIMDKTLHLIEKYRDEKIDLEKLPLDNPAVFDMLSAGQTDGVFQLESSGMKALAKDLKPNCFEDINALGALFRPGPLNSGMVSEFVNRKHGRSKVVYQHPILEPILKSTYGTIVYQEQIMQIAQQLAGYTLGQADLLRRAMGKKKAEEMAKQEETFLAGAKVQGVDERIARELFDAMTEFAKYCFNRSHSAAYAMISYQTAYLKAHYPVEYLSALLSSVSSDLDKIQLYILTARKMGIQVLPPDVNKSDADFAPDGNDIRFGLASVKNVGAGVVERIIASRPFACLEDFCERAELKNMNRRALESLIRVGALDSFGISRKQLFSNIDTFFSYAARLQERKDTGQVSLFGGMQEKLMLISEPDEYPSTEIQQFEKELLGSYVSSHPLDDVLDILPLTATSSVKELAELSEGAQVVLSGLITAMVQKTTKTNRPLRIGHLQDFTGSVEFVAFSDAIAQFESLLVEGQKVILTGKLQQRGDDSISIVLQSIRPLDSVKILNLKFKQLPRFEEIAHLRELFLGAKGDDPVVLDWPDNSRMLIGPNFWVNFNMIQQALQPALSNGLGNLVEMSRNLAQV